MSESEYKKLLNKTIGKRVVYFADDKNQIGKCLRWYENDIGFVIMIENEPFPKKIYSEQLRQVLD